MDSGNSGSIQSSSGDEEYDSHAAAPESIPSFINPSLHQFVSISDRHPSLLSLHYQPSIFDISPNCLHALSQSQITNQSSLPNVEAAHDTPAFLRSDNITHGAAASSSAVAAASASERQSFLVSDHGLSHIDHQVHPSSVQADNARAISVPTNGGRNSKKRTRASRRAPTTVLTTDTSNFRAMVQEFTGIPAPPFSGLSYARRLDLLTGSSSLLRSNANSNLEPPGSFYPLRPSAQKIQQYPYITHNSSSTLLHQNTVDSIPSTANMGGGAITSNNSSAPSNYHLLPHDHLGLLSNHHQHMLALQNHPILTFQSSPGFHGSSSSTLHDNFGAKSRQELPMDSLEELGMNHGQVNPNLVQNEMAALRSNEGYRHVQLLSEAKREQMRSNYDGSAYRT